MHLEPRHHTNHFAKGLGIVLGYLLFTTVLFFVLTFLHKLPASWTYFHLAGLTILIGLFGYALQRWLA